MPDENQPAPAPEAPDLVTVEDHEAGFKELDLTFRSGRRARIRLEAIPARVAAQFHQQFAAGQDVMEKVLQASFPANSSPDKLDAPSYTLASFVAFALAFGYETQKKILALAAAGPANPSTLAAPSAAASSPSSAPAAISGTSGAGPGRG